MKKGAFFICMLALVVSLSPLAMANGLNLNSIGSRALAMGGAFVGLADDFSTIFWNPAGISKFKNKYFGFYGTDLLPSSTYKLEAIHPVLGKFTVVDAESESKNYLSGMAAYYHPISENLVAGIGVYVPSGLGVTWNGSDFANLSNKKAYEWMSKVSLVTIAPALSYKINDMVSIGATLNINYGMFDTAMHAGSAPVSPTVSLDLGQYEESLSGWGIGATFGVLVKPSEMIQLGATFRTASTVEYEGKAKISNLSLLSISSESDLTRKVTNPMWLAGGIAFKPINKLTLTADVQFTNWKELQEIEAKYKNPFWELLMAKANKDKMEFLWENTTQLRFGAEYQLNENLALRAGYYYDPSPAPDKTLNVLIPSYSYNVFAIGFGYNLGGLQIDAAFEYLAGKQREVSYVKVMTDPEFADAMPGVYTMKIIVPNISISYRF